MYVNVFDVCVKSLFTFKNKRCNTHERVLHLFYLFRSFFYFITTLLVFLLPSANVLTTMLMPFLRLES